MKTTHFRFFCTALLALSLAQLAHAADVAVISNSGTRISAAEAKEAFLGEKQFAGGTKLIPVDNAALQGSFLSQRLSMSVDKYNGLWTKKAFRDGLTAPAVKRSDAEVIEFVKGTPGAVGYVSSAPSGVNVAE